MTPTILMLLMAFEIFNLGHIRYEDYVYPISIQLLGQAITGISLIWIPVFAFWQNYHEDGAESKIWLLKPTQVSNSNEKKDICYILFPFGIRNGEDKRPMEHRKNSLTDVSSQ